MTLGNMRELGVKHRIGFCHNDASRRAAGQPELAYTHKSEISVRSCSEPDASGWRE